MSLEFFTKDLKRLIPLFLIPCLVVGGIEIAIHEINPSLIERLRGSLGDFPYLKLNLMVVAAVAIVGLLVVGMSHKKESTDEESTDSEALISSWRDGTRSDFGSGCLDSADVHETENAGGIKPHTTN